MFFHKIFTKFSPLTYLPTFFHTGYMLLASQPKRGQMTKELNLKGFTLIELLVVIGILAVLLAITLIAINPARQFQQANDTKRISDVNTILNAVHQYAADNKGVLPDASSATPIPTEPNGPTAIASTGVDLCADLVPTYIAALPSDPTTGSPQPGGNITNCSAPYDTGYTIQQSATDNRITVFAPAAQLQATIRVTR
jgi:type IV pilus assembly protein PilA